MDKLKEKTYEFIKILFPDFETCQQYYYDPDIDSSDVIKQIMAKLNYQQNAKINEFNFEKYINANKYTDLYNYITSFLSPKFESMGTIIFNTLAKKIISNTAKKENEIWENNELFTELVNNELEEFFNFITKLTGHNTYFLSSHNLYIEESLEGEDLCENIKIKKAGQNPIFSINNTDGSIKYALLLTKCFTLIFGEEIKFHQDEDIHTKTLREYIYENCTQPINYQFKPLMYKIKINYEQLKLIQQLLPKYIKIINSLKYNDYKNISLDFYMDSLRKFGTSKITYSVISMEALLNSNEHKLKEKFKNRGTEILKFKIKDRSITKLKKDLETAYKIRSEYSHGTTRRHTEATDNLCYRISEYARILLITYLQLSIKLMKSQKRTSDKTYIKNIIKKSIENSNKKNELYNLLEDLEINLKDLNKINRDLEFNFNEIR